MKKFIYLFIVLITSACASQQVTVTSEVTVTLAPPTSIPTPTLHPEFIAWQELISSSGRYTLTPDGFIQENGIVINGLQVDSNGIMTLTVNNEKIILNTSDITFAEDGINTKDYELNENGEWVEAMSESERQMYTDFEKFNQDLDQAIESGAYTVVIGEDDSVTVQDAKGKEVYKNGSFEPLFLGQLIVENNMCKKTEWTSSKIGNTWPGNDVNEFRDRYVQSVLKTYNILVQNRTIKGTGSVIAPYHLGGGCWGVVISSGDKSNGWFFWKNEDGSRVFWKQVDGGLSNK